MPKVLAVALNPSLDKTLTVDKIIWGSEARVRSVSCYAGGKAVNVARALQALDTRVKLIGVLAGNTGAMIEEDLRLSGLLQEWIFAKGETRTNITLQMKQNGKTARLLEPGEPLSLASEACFRKIFLKGLKEANAAVFSGSLPFSMDTKVYARLIRMARAQHVMTVLDTSGEALREGLQASPFLIKPNRQEAEDVLGYSLSSRKTLIRALKELAGFGPRIVLISLGADGLIGFEGARVFMATAPERQGMTVGCGDAALAGFMSAFLNGDVFNQCLRYAAACGTANVAVGIPGALDKKKINSVLKKTRVKQLV